jgi:hypothetical protein
VPTIEHKVSFDKVFDGVTNHVKRHKVAYSFGAGVAIVGVTCLVTRGISFRGGLGVSELQSGLSNAVSFERNATLNNVSFIFSNRQGPPSWVVRCLETKEIFSSQWLAAQQKGLSQSHLSSHLNGKRDHVNGLHFERICLMV